MKVCINRRVVRFLSVGVLGLSLCGCSGKSKTETSSQTPPAQVKVRQVHAQPHHAEALLRGTVAAWRKVTLCARTQGTVVKIAADRGASVQGKDPLVILSADDRQEKCAEAEAKVKMAALEDRAVRALAEEDYQSRLACAQKKSALDQALAQKKTAQLTLAYACIRAPFKGQVYERLIEIGETVNVGTKISSVADLSTVRIIVYCSERDYPIARGAISVAARIKGKMYPATIVSLTSVADPHTRMYRMDVRVTNDGTLADGMTAEVLVKGPAQKAHYILSSALCLSDEGRTGVKILDGDGKVCFCEVQVLSLDAQGAWVSGLKESVAMITLGQDFVSVGQTPTAQKEE
ncbi:MAG: efflux RND transporter periplasmic adaptor subunit [Holosporales bacterium]|jgi:multidrug efflux system membrane fusion protein|nr:efflux RND transporter periplasmic adaptor subunit [Holosporales bacterium]